MNRLEGEGFIRSVSKAEKTIRKIPAVLKKEEGRVHAKAIALTSVAGGVLALGVALIFSGGGSTEAPIPTGSSTNTPEVSSDPYELQMPPPPPDGATCDQVLQHLSDLAEDKPYFHAGDKILIYVKVAGVPEVSTNGVVILEDVNNQGQADQIKSEIEPRLQKWYQNTEVAGKLRFSWVSGGIIDDEDFYVNPEITLPHTGPDEGCVPIGPIE